MNVLAVVIPNQTRVYMVRLILDEIRMIRGPNADRAGQASMLLVAAIVLCLFAAPWWPPGP